ncbi:MAG TPA: SDR family oxidoreductase, partial [bacterium]|nr:SDR family oxidoreductase [bacterium]
MAREEGVIINMNGGGATVPLPGGSGYGCSKAAVMRLTDTLARELEKVGSRVLVFGMGPGLVRTKMTELQAQTEAGRKWIPSTEQAFKEGRSRQPEECARATMELLRIACPELNGRNFGVGMNFEDIKKRAAEIKEKDLLVMRGR